MRIKNLVILGIVLYMVGTLIGIVFYLFSTKKEQSFVSNKGEQLTAYVNPYHTQSFTYDEGEIRTILSSKGINLDLQSFNKFSSALYCLKNEVTAEGAYVVCQNDGNPSKFGIIVGNTNTTVDSQILEAIASRIVSVVDDKHVKSSSLTCSFSSSSVFANQCYVDILGEGRYYFLAKKVALSGNAHSVQFLYAYNTRILGEKGLSVLEKNMHDILSFFTGFDADRLGKICDTCSFQNKILSTSTIPLVGDFANHGPK
mgnify:CR=1 FL=1